MPKTFPKVIYVKHEGEGEDAYLVASEDVVDHIELREKVRLGVYQLAEVQIGEGLTKLTPAKK